MPISTSLETAHVKLEKLKPSHFDEILSWDVSPRQSMALFKNPLRLTRESLGLMLKDPLAQYFVMHNAQNALGGLVGFHGLVERQKRAQLSAMLNPLGHLAQVEYEEGIAALVRHLFEVYKLRKIQSFFLRSDVNFENTLIKMGAKSEGVLQEHFYNQGKHRDILVYAISPESFK